MTQTTLNTGSHPSRINMSHHFNVNSEEKHIENHWFII